MKYMTDRARYIALHFQSEFSVRLRFQLLREIDLYNQNRAGIWKENKSIVEELEKGIVSGDLTRYSLTDDYITEHYGINQYIKSSLISNLAFYAAGKDILKGKKNITLDYLESIWGNMEGGFFLGFIPENDELSNLVGQVKGLEWEVISKSRDINRQKGALEYFCKSLDNLKDEDEIIKRINHYNDGSYMELWDAISCLAHYLVLCEMWDDYYVLLDALKYFPLQGGMIRTIHSASDCDKIIAKVFEKSGRKSLHYILRDYWFHLCCEEDEILNKNSKIEELEEEDKLFISKQLNDVCDNKLSQIKKLVGIWKDVFGKEELSVWVAEKVSEAERKHEKYGKPELDVLKLIEEENNLTSDDVKGFSLEGKDLSSLLSFAKSVNKEDVAVNVTEAIAGKIFADKSYPDNQLNNNWFEHARTIYRCLLISKKDGLSLIPDKKYYREGFHVNLSRALLFEQQEAYWLAILILSLEESKDEELFERIIDTLFLNTCYQISSLTDDVFTPYYIAELLVSQVLKQKKDDFERRLLNEIPNLVFVIRVLSANEGEMSDEVKNLLSNRIGKDWLTERRLLSQNKMIKLDFYDEFVKEYLNSNSKHK